ncbi:MAG: c-type cytochrome [Gammaproteobacteria bacterium]|nr:c-type cytochrome [Gammaproteobacteria bacterium]MCF6230215.1 c-type cytochrome [Gammaproteobacteria bacterium]
MNKTFFTALFRGLFALALCFSSAVAASTGESIYQEHCVSCHGIDGGGRGSTLNPPPRDFTSMQSAFELDPIRIYISTTKGRPNSAMAAWDSRLSRDEIRQVSDYIYDTFIAEVKAALPEELRLNLEAGEKTYMDNCSVCHGDFGETGVWTRSNMATAPRNFTTDRTKGELSRKRMIESITYGRAGKAMMPYGSRLNQQEISSMVDYIRLALMGLPVEAVLAEKSILEGSRRDSPSTGLAFDDPKRFMSIPFPNGLYGDPNEGREIFVRNCFVCHGVKGDGQGPRAFFINPKPRNFISSDSRRALNRPKIYEAVYKGLSGSVMPAWSKVLSDQEVANVAEFVFRAFIRSDMPGVSEEDLDKVKQKKNE